MALPFHIQSAQTEYYLVSNGLESDGSVVETVPENERRGGSTVRILVHVLNLLTVAAWQILIIDPPIESLPVETSLTGQVPGLLEILAIKV